VLGVRRISGLLVLYGISNDLLIQVSGRNHDGGLPCSVPPDELHATENDLGRDQVLLFQPVAVQG
jgi:hypothetical protein